MSALDPNKMRIYRELLRRKNEMTSEEQELLGQVGRKFALQAGGDPKGKGVDTQRSAFDVAADQTREVVEGGKNLIPGMLKSARDFAVVSGLGGPSAASRAAAQGIVGAAKGTYDTVAPVVQSAKRAENILFGVPDEGKLSAIDTMAVEPDDPRWKVSAQGAGANAAGILLGEGVSKAGPAVKARLQSLAPSEASLKSRAAANRAVGGDIIDTWAKAGNAAGGTVRALRQTYSKIAAPIQERLAAKLAHETPEQAYAREVGQRNQDFSPDPAVDQRIGGVNRPSTPKFVESELDRLRNTETPEETYARQQAQRNVEFQPETSPSESFLKVQRPGPQQVVGTPAAQAGLAPEVNRWIGVKPAKMMRGADPGARFVRDGVFNPDKEVLAANIEKAMPAIESQMDSLLQAATKKGIKIKGDTIVTENLTGIRKLLGTPRDATFDANISGLLDDIVNAHPNIDKLTPVQAQALKVHLGKSIKWTGQAAETPINKAMIEMYHDLNDAIKTNVPGIDPVQKRWGDYFIGTKSIQESIVRDAAGTGTGKLFKPKN